MTSRAAGDVLLSVAGRVDFAGLSGSPPPVSWADANFGAQEILRQKTIVRNDCLFMPLIDFLDALLCSGYATGLTRISGGYGTVFCGVSSQVGSRNGLPLNSPVTVRV